MFYGWPSASTDFCVGGDFSALEISHVVYTSQECPGVCVIYFT